MRTRDDILAAQALKGTLSAQAEAETPSPGQAWGGQFSIEGGRTVISPFEVEINGKLYTRDGVTDASEFTWVVPRVDAKRYSVYSTWDGELKVDAVGPSFSEDKAALYHPNELDRYMGSFYLSSNVHSSVRSSGSEFLGGVRVYSEPTDPSSTYIDIESGTSYESGIRWFFDGAAGAKLVALAKSYLNIDGGYLKITPSGDQTNVLAFDLDNLSSGDGLQWTVSTFYDQLRLSQYAGDYDGVVMAHDLGTGYTGFGPIGDIDEALHVYQGSGNAYLLLETDNEGSYAGLRLSTYGNNTWRIYMDGGLKFYHENEVVTPFTIAANGLTNALTIDSAGVNMAGTLSMKVDQNISIYESATGRFISRYSSANNRWEVFTRNSADNDWKTRFIIGGEQDESTIEICNADFFVDTDTLYVDAANDWIGINAGTTKRNDGLNIVGSGTIGGSNLANAWLLLGTTTTGLGLDSNEVMSKGAAMYVGTTDAYALYFYAGGASVGAFGSTGSFSVDSNTLYVDATNDRVGVNDLTPSYSLDVNGTFRATGNSLIGGTLGVTGIATFTSRVVHTVPRGEILYYTAESTDTEDDVYEDLKLVLPVQVYCPCSGSYWDGSNLHVFHRIIYDSQTAPGVITFQGQKDTGAESSVTFTNDDATNLGGPLRVCF